MERRRDTPSVHPHLKQVLKKYQTSAMTTLNGPSSVIESGHVTTAASPLVSGEDDDKPVEAASVTSLPFAPFVAGSDPGSQREEVVFEGKSIPCFTVGGEKRLCLYSIFTSVLRDFSLSQINQTCDDLRIFCSQCNPAQLRELKDCGILPASAPSCGLITRTDAERLCSVLLRSAPPRLPSDFKTRPFGFKVYHLCFGKAKGICYLDWYDSPEARCIECIDCLGLMSPEHFVSHVCRRRENRTVHWGYDSSHWRSYILLADDQERCDKLQVHLDDFKNRFDPEVKPQNLHKRKQEEPGRDLTATTVHGRRQDVGASFRVVLDLTLPGYSCMLV
ncbi:unnamed protein product [Cyprideis torosa]|uniref:Uncharacterized protein n=1 Tax=Cyprideis torosa TaxID=163714 RepID=A0A7R8W9I0_9CRUS|nr:unnamed protein product [Cyprideis torosa]CAG0889828.1 unnamed protein product [Cyprideis torosa]